MDKDLKAPHSEENANSEEKLMDRRRFLLGLRKWSMIVIGVPFSGRPVGLGAGADARGAWANRAGGGGAWANRGGGAVVAPGGAWANAVGGGGAWANAAVAVAWSWLPVAHGQSWCCLANRGAAWSIGFSRMNDLDRSCGLQHSGFDG